MQIKFIRISLTHPFRCIQAENTLSPVNLLTYYQNTEQTQKEKEIISLQVQRVLIPEARDLKKR